MGDFERKILRLLVADSACIRHHPDLATRIDRIRITNTLEGSGEIFQVTHPIDVGVGVITPRTWSGRRNRIGRFDEK